MGDKELMEKELLTIKGACDLYLHGAVEASSEPVHTAFKEALNDALNIQNKLYNLMKDRGWYQTEMVEQNKINTLKQKYEDK